MHFLIQNKGSEKSLLSLIVDITNYTRPMIFTPYQDMQILGLHFSLLARCSFGSLSNHSS